MDGHRIKISLAEIDAVAGVEVKIKRRIETNCRRRPQRCRLACRVGYRTDDAQRTEYRGWRLQGCHAADVSRHRPYRQRIVDIGFCRTRSLREQPAAYCRIQGTTANRLCAC